MALDMENKTWLAGYSLNFYPELASAKDFHRSDILLIFTLEQLLHISPVA